MFNDCVAMTLNVADKVHRLNFCSLRSQIEFTHIFFFSVRSVAMREHFFFFLHVSFNIQSIHQRAKKKNKICVLLALCHLDEILRMR